MLQPCYRFLLTTLLYALAGIAMAMDVKVEFSAEAVQMAPQRPTMHSTMYVSKKAVRTESSYNNQQMVEIVFPRDGRRLMLIPQQRAYMEQTGLPVAPIVNSQQKNFSPCTGIPYAECKKLGVENLQGRQAQKWEITVQREGQKLSSTHWIDAKRNMPLREIFPDGTRSELTLLKNEKMNGRKTEKWQVTMTRPDGQSMQSSQWYDPQLQMMIREELPGGYVRELRNIKVGKQSAKLFEIPNGYQRMMAPPATPANLQVR